MKWNIFKPDSTYYPFRWFLMFALIINGFLLYANFTGWRIFAEDSQQQWAAKGPGYHK